MAELQDQPLSRQETARDFFVCNRLCFTAIVALFALLGFAGKIIFMTTQQLRTMHQARPFQPFDIHLADGRSIPVDHPELLAIATGGRTISVAVHDDAFEVIDLLLVTSLKPRSNGAVRSKRPRS